MFVNILKLDIFVYIFLFVKLCQTIGKSLMYISNDTTHSTSTTTADDNKNV